MYYVTKNYTPEQGLSATFRQWRAKSHCRFIHGYALGVEVTFGCEEKHLDENGWVLNFGGLKAFKQYLTDTFDHKTLVAKDDPALQVFKMCASLETFQDRNPGVSYEEVPLGPLIQLVEVERTGCEAFAKMIYDWLAAHLHGEGGLAEDRDVKLKSVRVYEHAGNSATYYKRSRSRTDFDFRVD